MSRLPWLYALTFAAIVANPLITLTTYASTEQKQAPLRYTVTNSLTLPLANISMVNGHYKVANDDALLIKLAHKIGAELGLEVALSTTGRDQVINELLNNQSDMICYLVPQWLGLAATSFKWTDAFMETRDVLISTKTLPPIYQTQQLQGLNIGLIKHYNYPILQELLDSQNIHPVYATSEANSFIQLFKNHDVDAIVLKEIVFDWLAAKHHSLLKNKHVLKHPLIVEFVEPQCAVSRHRTLDMKAINRGIQAFREQMTP